MLKRIIAIFCVVVMLFVMVSPATADPLTLPMVSAVTFAFFNSCGIDFTAVNGTSQGMSDYFGMKIQNYVDDYGGGSLESVFGSVLPQAIGGKLVVSHLMINGCIDFLNQLITDYGLGYQGIKLCLGEYGGLYIDQHVEFDPSSVVPSMGYYVTFDTAYGEGYRYARIWLDGSQIGYLHSNSNQMFTGEYYYGTGTNPNGIYARVHEVRKSDFFDLGYREYLLDTINYPSLPNQLSWNIGQDYSAPDTLTSNEHWEGDIEGYDYPETSLQEMIDGINSGIAGNSIDVAGQVIDDSPLPPQPTTTPVPTYPPAETVLDGVNTVIDQGNDTLEDLNDIDITTGGLLEGVNDLIGVDQGISEDVSDIAGTAEEVLEGIDNLGNDVGGIYTDVDGIATDVGGIATDVGGIASDVGDIAGDLEGVGEGVADIADTVGDIADAIQPIEIQTQRIDLKTLFPFCIPFDIYNMLRKFDASPVAPRIQFPLVIQSIGFRYDFDLDFSIFNPVAQIARTVELIIYALGLAWATSKVIKW